MAGMYDNFIFPDYEYREWPMAISLDEEGRPTKDPFVPNTKPKRLREVVIVQNEDELTALLEGSAEVQGSRIRTEADEKADLLTRAAQMGVKVDKSWSADRIRKTLDEKVSETHPL